MLSIAEPCHENWNGMLPEEKGRFCASCQKTVVDFTNMSDRQIADYFKKPAGSVCGRFYNDQLNRPISLPGKKLALPKHFFRYTWPAFMLLLKSCDEREEMVGDIVVETTPTTESLSTLGFALSEITPVDTSEVHFNKPIPIECGEVVASPPAPLIGDTTFTLQNSKEGNLPSAVDSSFVSVDTAWVDIDGLKITEYPDKQNIIKGRVAVTCGNASTENKIKQPLKYLEEKEDLELTVYPNPLSKGQSLNVEFKEKFTGVYYLFTIGGQVVKTGQITAAKGQRFSVPVQGLAAGSYLFRVADNVSKKTVTDRIIVQ